MNNKKNGEAHNNSKLNRNSTKKYKPIASRNKFQSIYTEPIDLKEDDPIPTTY